MSNELYGQPEHDENNRPKDNDGRYESSQVSVDRKMNHFLDRVKVRVVDVT